MNIDAKKAMFAVFRTGADHGDATSMVNLGIIYHYGHGVAEDYVKARDWYEKAAEKGNANAMFKIGLLYKDGIGGLARDYAKAREWYEKAADKGYAIAMGNLGLLYESGLRVAQDYAKAREWRSDFHEKPRRALLHRSRRGAGLCQGTRVVREGR